MYLFQTEDEFIISSSNLTTDFFSKLDASLRVQTLKTGFNPLPFQGQHMHAYWSEKPDIRQVVMLPSWTFFFITFQVLRGRKKKKRRGNS